MYVWRISLWRDIVSSHTISVIANVGLCSCNGRGVKQRCNIKVNNPCPYKASRYKSEVLRLWPQRCNTAKPTRWYNSFPQVHLQDMQAW
jgi:hypothetical protein